MITTQRDGAALLAAIKADPADDLPRLAFADWLDEAGQAERAGWIRESIRWPASSFVNLTRHDPFPLLGLEPVGTMEVHGWTDDGAPELQRRTWTWGESERMGLVVHDGGRDLHYRTDRGFIEGVYGPVNAWCGRPCFCKGRAWDQPSPCHRCHGTGREGGHGSALVRAHPVMRVEMADRTAVSSAGPHATGWHREGHDEAGNLPPVVFDLLQGGEADGAYRWYDDAQAADDDASDALLAWANLQGSQR